MNLARIIVSSGNVEGFKVVITNDNNNLNETMKAEQDVGMFKEQCGSHRSAGRILVLPAGKMIRS